MTNVNTYQIAKDYAESIMAERQYWDVDQLWDICAEHTDGSEHVIYIEAIREACIYIADEKGPE